MVKICVSLKCLNYKNRDVEPKALEDLKIKLISDTKEGDPNKLDGDFEIIDFAESPPRMSKARKSYHRRYGSVSSYSKGDEISRTGRSSQRKVISFDRLKQKPGKIFNKTLVYFDEDSNIRLKEDLLERKDYFLIDSRSWNFLNKWYG